MTTISTKKTIKGGEFLLEESIYSAVFTPEEYSEEQLMFRSSMRDFLNKEIEPIKEKFDSKEGTLLAPQLLEKMGELGFHGIGVPENYGGLNCDIKTEMAFGEIASDSFAFSQSIGVHTGLGVYPVLLYGNDTQKEKYLNDIVTAKIKCSYCLTEPSAGSDANAGKSKAIYSNDKKHFILNGQKMWITNSGFADVFFVFCKIEDDKNLSCLIVHKEWGVKLGSEENKLGIHGSSTRQVFFENIKVPVENLLGERNKGFKIAMNALNAGRIKIGVANTAIGKRALKLGINYANEREQFGSKISEFGAIKEKICKMATRLYGLESSWNRVAHQIDESYDEMIEEEENQIEAKIKSVAEYAMECAIIKVYGSETESFVVDESLQIHGGMGFSAESEISVHYRNVRGNRIYEGTNEINRILIPTMLFRKGMKGELPLMERTMALFNDLMSGILSSSKQSDVPFETENNFLSVAKKATLLVAGIAVQQFQQDIKNEQEVLMHLSDMITPIYIFESALLRAQKHQEKSEIYKLMTTILMYETSEQLSNHAKEVIFASSKENQALLNFKSINRLFQLPFANLKEMRRKVANHFIEKNQYQLT
ncbi:MAG: acyl-CoA dehydrogenase family protein [Flavobacteriales bacterium]|nr:acyl-CoA dehydrogenase family protein [Flavobacteriales bacterium]